MREPGKIYPIPCRNCGKLTLIQLSAGTYQLRCKKCSAVTDVNSRPVGPDLEVKTALAAPNSLAQGERLGG